MILKTAMLGALGYFGYKYCQKNTGKHDAAFADGQASGGNFAKVRDAGPSAMKGGNMGEWSKVDQASDQSFPASDPPANY